MFFFFFQTILSFVLSRKIECNTIETINSSKCTFTESIKYEKDPIKIRFDSYDDDDDDDDLPLDNF